jgi:hypothetical protein
MDWTRYVSFVTTTLILVVGVVIAGIILAYVADKLFLLKLKRRAELELEETMVPVMGEGEKLFKTVSHYLEYPFAVAREVLYLTCFLLPLMLLVNVLGFKEYNLWFSGLIILFAIRTVVRHPMLLGVMGLGVLENFLASTDEKPEDLSKGALEGLAFFAKLLCVIILAVWFSSIILSVLPFEKAPLTFFGFLLSICGIYIYAYLRMIPTWRMAQHVMILGPFIIMGLWSIELFSSKTFGVSLAAYAVSGTPWLWNLLTTVPEGIIKIPMVLAGALFLGYIFWKKDIAKRFGSILMITVGLLTLAYFGVGPMRTLDVFANATINHIGYSLPVLALAILIALAFWPESKTEKVEHTKGGHH